MQPAIHLNFLSIILASVSCFVLGFLWYSVFFAKPWREEMMPDGSKEYPISKMILALVINFIGCLLMAFVFTHNIQAWNPHTWGQNADFVPPVQAALMSAIFTWLGFYLPQDLNKVSFQSRSWRLFFIDTSFNFCSLLLAAFILIYVA